MKNRKKYFCFVNLYIYNIKNIYKIYIKYFIYIIKIFLPSISIFIISIMKIYKYIYKYFINIVLIQFILQILQIQKFYLNPKICIFIYDFV